MVPIYRRVRLYYLYIVLVLVVCFAAVASVLYWKEAAISESKRRNAEFHVPTILHIGKIENPLIRLEEKMAADFAGLGTAENRHKHLTLNDTKNKLYLVPKELETIAELQSEFGTVRFKNTLQKISVEFDRLRTALAIRSPPPNLAAWHREVPDQLVRLRALILSLEQLKRLHAISYEEVNKRLEEQVWQRNAIVSPSVLAIAICMLAGLTYLTWQTGRALNRLEEADRALQALNRDLEQRVETRGAELKAIQEELIRKERLAAVGQLTATVSHELRNPLGAIRSASDAIKRFAGRENAQMNRAIALLERSQGRCDKIIDELLDYTRVRELKLDRTRVDDWLKSLIAEQNRLDGIALRTELEAPIELAFDRDRLERAVRNVIENAYQAMQIENQDGAAAKKAELVVATRATERRLELSIKDTGPGIPAEARAKIFEPLYSTKSFGVGLGLPMVKQIMEQHGGGIEIKSEPGNGTEVLLWLPRPAPKQGVAA